MACTVERRRLYCTTADVSFGPLFVSDEEGEEFRTFMYQNHGDPRRFGADDLQRIFEEWSDGQLDSTKRSHSMSGKRSLVKLVVGVSEVKRGLAGYVVLADSVIMGERTLVLERAAGAVAKRQHRKAGAGAPVEPKGE